MFDRGQEECEDAAGNRSSQVVAGWVSGTFPARSGTFPVHLGTFSAHSVMFPAHSGTFPEHSGTFPEHSGMFPVNPGTFPAHFQRNVIHADVSFKCVCFYAAVFSLESVQKYKILLVLSPNHGMTYTSILMS